MQNGYLNGNNVLPTYRGHDSSSSNSFSSDINTSPSPPNYPNMSNGHQNGTNQSNGADPFIRNGYINASEHSNVPNGYNMSNRPAYITTSASYLKASSLERGTRGSSISK